MELNKLQVYLESKLYQTVPMSFSKLNDSPPFTCVLTIGHRGKYKGTSLMSLSDAKENAAVRALVHMKLLDSEEMIRWVLDLPSLRELNELERIKGDLESLQSRIARAATDPARDRDQIRRFYTKITSWRKSCVTQPKRQMSNCYNGILNKL